MVVVVVDHSKEGQSRVYMQNIKIQNVSAVWEAAEIN